MSYNFDMARWGSAEGNPQRHIAENLGLGGIAVNHNRSIMIVHNPKRPELTHLSLSVSLAPEKHHVGCFDSEVVQRAWDLGLDMLVTDEIERGQFGMVNILARRFLSEEFKIVRVQPEAPGAKDN